MKVIGEMLRIFEENGNCSLLFFLLDGGEVEWHRVIGYTRGVDVKRIRKAPKKR